MTDPIIQILDAEEALRHEKKNLHLRGRPTVLQEDRFTLEELYHRYTVLKSIRKVAEHFGISPTTVKKYLHGRMRPVGRPVQPQAWKARLRSPVHAWFVANRNKHLPHTLQGLSEMSGFSRKRIGSYLCKRRRAAQEYLKTLPEPTELETFYIDLYGRKISPTLIDQYAVTVDKFSLDLRFNFVLTTGTQSTVLVTFLKYLELCRQKKTPGATGSSV